MRQRQTQTPAHGSTGALARRITDTLYTSHGLVAQRNASYFNAATPSGSLQLTDPVSVPLETLTAYDGAERPIVESNLEYNVQVTDVAGHPWQTTTTYGGDHIDVTPPVGTTPTTTYADARGNTTELRQYHGTTASGPYDSTTYTYTPAGQLATTTDAAGDVWRYGYDVRGRRTSISDPDKGTTTSTYDAVGNLATTTDARGQTLAYAYDALNRRTEERDGGPSGPVLASWTYDPDMGFTSSANSFVDGHEYSVTTDAVDPAGRPTKQSVVIPTNEGKLTGTYTTTTTYEPDGSANTVVLPRVGNLGAEVLNYGYDALGAPYSMTSTTDYVVRTTYGQDNSVEQLQLGPDTKFVDETFSHDVSTDRLTGSSVATPTNGGAVDSISYGYDLSGNVTSETDTVRGQAADRQCFGYDYLQRLTDAWTTTAASCGAVGSSLGGPAPYWQTYSYNVLGDRTKLVRHATVAGGTDTTTTYNYATAGHAQALTSATTTGSGGTTTASYGYNATGDTTSRPGPDGATQSLTWNAWDRLSQVSEGNSGTASYIYDADGNRLITHDTTGATLFLPSGQVHVNAFGTATTGTRYYTFAGQTVAQRVGTRLVYLGGDDHGTAEAEIDATTLDATTRRYDPFGNPRDATGFPGNLGFIGGVDDTATGLTHLGARDYDPALGRFISVDPLVDSSDPATFDPYVYSQDNPATFSDPSGKFIQITDGVRDYPLPYHKPRPRPRPRPSKPAPKPRPRYVSVPSHDRFGDIDFRAPRFHRVRRASASHSSDSSSLEKDVHILADDYIKDVANDMVEAVNGLVDEMFRAHQLRKKYARDDPSKAKRFGRFLPRGSDGVAAHESLTLEDLLTLDEEEVRPGGARDQVLNGGTIDKPIDPDPAASGGAGALMEGDGAAEGRPLGSVILGGAFKLETE